jgi:hypothetical protein
MAMSFFKSIFPKVYADEEELVDQQTALRVS